VRLPEPRKKAGERSSPELVIAVVIEEFDVSGGSNLLIVGPIGEP
jgi:hypothetical protein